MENTFTLPPFTAEAIDFMPLSQSVDWGLKKLNIPEIWKETQGEGITIVVIDTGYPGTKGKPHPDLAKNALLLPSKSFVNGEDVYDIKQGHGTACAGVIAAENNEIGYVGYAPKAKVISVKALSNNGSGSLASIENALEYAISLKPDIVSMSLGSRVGSMKMKRLIRKLDDMNIPVVVAAGNGGAEEGVLYPAKYEEVFAIGAYDSNGKVAKFSAVGPEVDFCFPGVNVTTTFLNGGYAKLNGTSFACPACAGVLALIMAKHKKAVANGEEEEYKSTMDLYNILKDMSVNPNTNGQKDMYYGWGIVDVSRLKVDALEAGYEAKDVTISSFARFWHSVKRFFSSVLKTIGL